MLGNGGFLTPKPSFPVLGFLTPVRGKRIRNSKIRGRKLGLRHFLPVQLGLSEKFEFFNWKLRETCARTFSEGPPQYSVRIVQLHPAQIAHSLCTFFDAPAHLSQKISGTCRDCPAHKNFAQFSRGRDLFSKSASVQAISPKRPNLEEFQDLEIFKLEASHHQTPIFMGKSGGQDWNFQARLNFFKRDWIFFKRSWHFFKIWAFVDEWALEVPRVRLSISGVKSGTNPETPRKRSQSKFTLHHRYSARETVNSRYVESYKTLYSTLEIFQDLGPYRECLKARKMQLSWPVMPVMSAVLRILMMSRFQAGGALSLCSLPPCFCQWGMPEPDRLHNDVPQGGPNPVFLNPVFQGESRICVHCAALRIFSGYF